MEEERMKPNATNRRKQPYRSPRLVRYGDLKHLTGGKGSNKDDGGGVPKTKAGGTA